MSSVQYIIALPAKDMVFFAAAPNLVITGLSIQPVIVLASGDEVITGSAVDHVIAFSGFDHIVTTSAIQHRVGGDQSVSFTVQAAEFVIVDPVIPRRAVGHHVVSIERVQFINFVFKKFERHMIDVIKKLNDLQFIQFLGPSRKMPLAAAITRAF